MKQLFLVSVVVISCIAALTQFPGWVATVFMMTILGVWGYLTMITIERADRANAAAGSQHTNSQEGECAAATPPPPPPPPPDDEALPEKEVTTDEAWSAEDQARWERDLARCAASSDNLRRGRAKVVQLIAEGCRDRVGRALRLGYACVQHAQAYDLDVTALQQALEVAGEAEDKFYVEMRYLQRTDFYANRADEEKFLHVRKEAHRQAAIVEHATSTLIAEIMSA